MFIAPSIAFFPFDGKPNEKNAFGSIFAGATHFIAITIQSM